MQVVGLDIGGANLKAADAAKRAVSRAFPVWREPEKLSEKLREILGEFPRADLLAVTMTAELADCFQTKREGVDRILTAVEEAADSAPVFVWQTGAEFVSPEVARDIPYLVSAANWHALATWIGRIAPRGNALLVDVGSTTTDIIPLADGVPVPVGLTDSERLISGELVYTGARRTPVSAVASSVPLRGSECPLAAELFATMLDVHLLLGAIDEDPNDVDTANGKPTTRDAARDRLARAVCCDVHEVAAGELDAIARHLADAQCAQIAQAARRVLDRFKGPCTARILSGSGSFLAERATANLAGLAGIPTIRLQEFFAPEIAESACAYAVACLAAERLPGEAAGR
jgi:probable H4MPT-linked C1 transfer pathway protein